MFVKYIGKTIRLRPQDFTAGFWGMLSFAFLFVQIFYFTGDNENEFDLNLWLYGTFASLCNVLGSMFLIAALSTGAPMGPTSALSNS